MALPQIVTKTYSRRRLRQSDVSHAERTFDEVFRGESRPPARTSATAEKWGTASFKRICSATRTSPKRRMSPTRDSDDPFSFDSDDDNTAKKLRKENVRQKTAPGAATKQSAGVVDGRCSVDTERPAVGAKSPTQLMNCREKSCADNHAHHNETRSKQCAEKMTRCRTVVKAQLKSVDCADGERNGLSNYLATASVNAGGDSVELSERNCRSNGVDSAADSGEKKVSGRAAGMSTRSSDPPSSPCKTTQQLKVFVDNFQLLLSSQRSPVSRRCQPPDTHGSSGKSSSAEELGSPASKSKGSENCWSSSGQSLTSRHGRGSAAVKTASSSLHRRKHLHQSTSDNDSNDDDDVILLSPLPAKPAASHSLDSTRTASNTGKTISGNCSLQSSSSALKISSGVCTNSLSVKSVASSGTIKNEAGRDKSGHLRSRRRRTSAESEPSGIATTTAAATVTTATRRLLTGSRKVSSHLLQYTSLNI